MGGEGTGGGGGHLSCCHSFLPSAMFRFSPKIEGGREVDLHTRSSTGLATRRTKVKTVLQVTPGCNAIRPHPTPTVTPGIGQKIKCTLSNVMISLFVPVSLLAVSL